MAQEKILDMTKSAAANETAVNNKFEELKNRTGGLTEDDLKGTGIEYLRDSEYSYGALFGNEVLSGESAFGEMTRLLNSASVTEQILNNNTPVSDSSHVTGSVYGYGHEPMMVKEGNLLYIVASINTQLKYETPASPANKIMLFSATCEANPTVIPIGDVFKNGDDVDLENGTNYYVFNALSPNIANLTVNGRSILRIWACVTVRDALQNHTYSMAHTLYRDYDIATGEFGDISTTKIVDENGVERVLNAENLKTVQGFTTTSGEVEAHSQWSYNSTTGLYYICLSGGDTWQNPFIYTTPDFITYTHFMEVSVNGVESLSHAWEMALQFWWDGLYFATRQVSTLGGMVVGKIDRETKRVSWAKTIPVNASRPRFFCKGTSTAAYPLYLFYVPNNKRNRWISGIARVTHERDVTCVANTLSCTYPSVIYYDGWFYVAYQGQGIRVSRFKIPFDWSNSIPVFEKIANLFNPND